MDERQVSIGQRSAPTWQLPSSRTSTPRVCSGPQQPLDHGVTGRATALRRQAIIGLRLVLLVSPGEKVATTGRRHHAARLSRSRPPAGDAASSSPTCPHRRSGQAYSTVDRPPPVPVVAAAVGADPQRAVDQARRLQKALPVVPRVNSAARASHRDARSLDRGGEPGDVVSEVHIQPHPVAADPTRAAVAAHTYVRSACERHGQFRQLAAVTASSALRIVRHRSEHRCGRDASFRAGMNRDWRARTSSCSRSTGFRS
jgi:hypothetical protein